MQISTTQKRVIIGIVNAFETGKLEGDYGKVVVYVDGPVVKGKPISQITYGRSQATEFYSLKEILKMYAERGGRYSAQIEKYLDKVGKKPSLCTDATFKKLLQDAGNDAIMQQCQDEVFDARYYQPAKEWAEENGFVEQLSLAVIYDSYIHSGKIREDIRASFPEKVPSQGGNERKWISEYVAARREWLANRKGALKNTVYRMDCFLNQIKNDNWSLVSAVWANGVKV